jgi:hypothetical protein
MPQHHRTPIVVVLGQFRSGSSCVAGVLHALGIDMGPSHRDPCPRNPKGYFEDAALSELCQKAFREPAMTRDAEAVPDEEIVRRLADWAVRRVPADPPAAMIGAKHPTLCLMVPHIVRAWGDAARLVAVDRDPSLSARSWRIRTPEASAAVARMRDERDRALASIDHLRVSYDRLLDEPHVEIQRLCRWLGVRPGSDALDRAVEFVDPSLRTVSHASEERIA